MPHQCTDCGTTFADGSTEMLSGCPDCGGNTFQFLPDGISDSQSSPESDAEAEPATGSQPPSEPGVDPDRPARPSTGESVVRTMGSAAQTVREFVGNGPEGPGTSPEAADPLAPWPQDRAAEAEAPDVDKERDPTTASDPTAATITDTQSREDSERETAAPEEDVAQASARSAVVGPDELPGWGTAEMAAGATSVADHTQSTESSVADPPADSTASEESERPDLEELREELNDQFESIRIVEPGQYELNLMELYEREEYIIALQEDGRYRIQVPESWQD